MWTECYRFTTKRFALTLDVTDEDFEPDWLIDPEEQEQLLHDIERGKLVWFCARVRVLFMGREIGSDYLGGCCYSSVEEFRRNSGGYFGDMVAAAVTEARAFLREAAA